MRKSDPPKHYVLDKGEVPSLAAGPHTMRGYASSPFGIQRVEYSVDGGRTWQEAKLVPPPTSNTPGCDSSSRGMRQPGKHVLMTRATDKKGKTQPETIPFNELGINCNVMPRFPVQVV